nr:hypothetical protein [Tanacetum cinerariifolium]
MASKNKEFKAMKKTTNKFSILETLPDDDPVKTRLLKDIMIVDQFLNKKIQPSVQKAQNWTQDMGHSSSGSYVTKEMKDFKYCIKSIELEDIGSLRVKLLKGNLQEAQALVEKNPHNCLKKVKAVEALYEYNEAVKDEEKLLA